MKHLKKLLPALCVATVLSFSNPLVYSSPAELNGHNEVSNHLNQEVKKGLDDLISDLENSLKENIPNVEEVFKGSAIEKEIGVGIKIYRNMEKKDYYYFIMASADTYTDSSSNDKLLFTNDLAFSFDKERFFSKLEEYHSLNGREASGRASGKTFVLDNSIKEFYLGVKYVDITEQKEGRLIYFIKILSNVNGYSFEGETIKNK